MFWHCADIVIIPAPMTQFTLADADKPRLERVFELNALDDALDAYIIARIVREGPRKTEQLSKISISQKSLLVPKSTIV